MKNILSRVVLAALTLTMVPAHATFSLNDGLKATAQSKAGLCLAAVTLMAATRAVTLVGSNPYVERALEDADSYADSSWLERLRTKLAILPELFQQSAWVEAPRRHTKFRNTLATGIASLAALAGLSIYNGFKGKA